MTNSQYKTYIENQGFRPQQIQILDLLMQIPTATATEIVEQTHMKIMSVYPRLSELHSIGIIKIVGEKPTQGGYESVYSLCTIEERAERQKEIKKGLEAMKQEYKTALTILKDKFGYTAKYLNKEILRISKTLQRLSV